MLFLPLNVTHINSGNHHSSIILLFGKAFDHRGGHGDVRQDVKSVVEGRAAVQKRKGDGGNTSSPTIQRESRHQNFNLMKGGGIGQNIYPMDSGYNFTYILIDMSYSLLLPFSSF